MTSKLEFQRSDRLLVLAPHPDDETLATGGLIQRALAAGAAVRLLVATDGDNNPWPQRWLERRLRIDSAARTRWGQRRREESRRALAILGLPTDAVRYFGWPDLGVTDGLLANADAEQAIAAEIESFAPTHLAAPVLFDQHPDHNALSVLVDVALASINLAKPRRLGYVVHGAALAEGSSRVALTVAEQQIKQRALFAHVTQVSLSEKRLLAIAARTERFEINAKPSASSLPSGALRLRISAPPRRLWSRRQDLLLVVGTGGQVARARVALPVGNTPLQTDFGDSNVQLSLRREGDAIDLTVSARERIHWGFVKIERSGSRVVIYDCEGWHDFRDGLVDSGTTTEVALWIGRR